MYHAIRSSPAAGLPDTMLRFDHEIDRDNFVSADPAARRTADPPADSTGFMATVVGGVGCQMKKLEAASDTPLTDLFKGRWATVAVNKLTIFEVAQQFERDLGHLKSKYREHHQEAERLTDAIRVINAKFNRLQGSMGKGDYNDGYAKGLQFALIHLAQKKTADAT